MSRILVVDDDPDMRALVATFLKAAGHQVELAEDGVAGVAAVAKAPPDLVVTDFQMPRMDGFGLFNAVRANPRGARVPIVMVTAHNSRDMMLKALGLGLDDFLGKPITQADLLRVVNECLGGRAARPAAAVPAAPKAEFFGSVLCCEIHGLERFALELRKEELDELLAQFAAEATVAVQRDGGWVSRPDPHHLVAAFEDGVPAGARGHALRALHSALALVLAAQRLKPWIASRFAGRDLPEFVVALGVHSGKVQVDTAGGKGLRGEATEIATFLAESILGLHWSVAASRAAAKAAGFAFLAGRGAQLRMPNTGTVKVVEVKGLERPAEAAPRPDRVATLIEAAVDRNATLVSYAAAAPKPAAPPAGAAVPAAALAASPVPGYTVVRKLAENGIVAAYLVTRQGGGPQEVLKTILVQDDKKRPHLQKFIGQYAGLGAIAQPNLGRLTAQGLTATHLYAVQEYCPGGDLRNLIAERMMADAAIKALLRIAGVLKAAHQKGYIHGDLKPGNVMLRADGSLALVDFALARIVEYVAGEGESGVMFRSPEYLSPEMINGQLADAQTDVYTLGLLLHEMLTGRRAYESPDLSRVMTDHLNAPVPKLPAGLERFQGLLDRLMAKRRDERFATMQDVITFMAQARL